MASITKVETVEGIRWKARVSYFDNQNKRKFKQRNFLTKQEAKYWADKNEIRKVEEGTLYQSQQPLTEYFNSWYITYKEPNIKRATKQWYAATQKAIDEYFGETPISQISILDYQAFLNHLAQTRVKSSVSKMNSHIRSAVSKALEQNLIRLDFTKGAVIGGAKKEKSRDLKFLEENEMWNLIHLCKEDVNVQHTSKAMIITALYTGMRLAEIGGLTWNDIDYEAATININKNYNYYSETETFTDTKNYQSNRTIKVNSELLDILKELKRQQLSKFTALKIENKDNLVFINSYDKVPSSSGVNKTLRELLRTIYYSDHKDMRKKILGLNFHSLRHTHASYLLLHGVSIYYISSRLGHSSIKTTLNVYSHILNRLEVEQETLTLQAFEMHVIS